MTRSSSPPPIRMCWSPPWTMSTSMAAGCSMLETSANPYVIALGPESTATRRLNLAQAFNPVGTNLGVFLAATLILPKLADPVDISSLTTGSATHDPRRRAGGGHGAIRRPRDPADPDRDRHRNPEGAADRGGVPRRELLRGRHSRAVWRPVAQQALPPRRGCPVYERRRAGVHVDVPDPVCGPGARRQPHQGSRIPAGESLDLPRLALSHDLGDRIRPGHQGAGGARVPCRCAVRCLRWGIRTWQA